MEKYDIKFDDDNKNSIFDKILNEPKKRVKDMLSKDINMDKDSINEIISNREIIKGKC